MKIFDIMLIIGVTLAGTNAFAANSITPQDANVLALSGEGILVDVRERSELEATGIAQPAAWLAKSAIDGDSSEYRDFLRATPSNKVIILYCRSGGRAGATTPKFEQLGYTVYNMGGLVDWQNAGLPVSPFQQQPPPAN